MMTLYSPAFLLTFMPLSAVVYRILPARFKDFALSLFSLLFYILAAGKCFFLLPVLAVAVYFLSFCGKKGFYICLLLFLPIRIFGIYEIGISFFLLRAASYIYDGKNERNFFKLFAFLLFFPTVHSGPLERYSDFARGYRATPPFSQLSHGILLVIYGSFKKLFFADSLFYAFKLFFDGDTAFSALLALISYSLYIYFDFSGCSDVAVGAGKLFGFDLHSNFDFPYLAKSVGEFFTRWHITLGRWLFRYVYIPLGGNRCGKRRQVFALLAVWGASALWHGTKLSYLVWGLYFLAVSIAEKILLPKNFKIGRICTLFVVLIGWVFFFSDTPKSAVLFLSRLFCIGDTLLYCRADIYNFSTHAILLLLALLFATPLVHTTLRALYEKVRAIAYAMALCAFAAVLSCIVSGGHVPFLYASF